MDIVTRKEWGAVAPKSRSPLPKSEFRGWFIHWLGNDYPNRMTDTQVLQSAQRFHMNTRGWSDIGYSFAVGQDARAYELRGWGVDGGHTEGYNSSHMAIVFLIGEGEEPTIDMIRTATDLIEEGRRLGYTSTTVRPHRDAPGASTACPGPTLATWARSYNHARDYTPAPDSKETATMDTEALVRRLYAEILPGHEDATGIAFWKGKLDRREMTHADLLQHFTSVRLAALAAELEALKRVVADGSPVGDIHKARDDFFKELRAWAAALPA